MRKKDVRGNGEGREIDEKRVGRRGGSEREGVEDMVEQWDGKEGAMKKSRRVGGETRCSRNKEAEVKKKKTETKKRSIKRGKRKKR